MKRIHDTAAGSAIGAYVILNPKGKHVATVRSHTGSGGGVTVEVCNYNQPDVPLYINKAGGYGYDKFTAALSGATIDGHKLTDHCEGSLPKPKRGYWLQSDKVPKGYALTNPYREPLEGGAWVYMDCHRDSGLTYLRSLGYTIIQAM